MVQALQSYREECASTLRLIVAALHQLLIITVTRLCSKVSQELACVESNVSGFFLCADHSHCLITFTTQRQPCCKYDST